MRTMKRTTQGSAPLALTTAPTRAPQARPVGSPAPAAAPAPAPPAAPGHQPPGGPSGMDGWPQEGQWAAEDRSSQGAKGGRSPEAGAASPRVAHVWSEALEVLPGGVVGKFWKQAKPAV